MIKLGVAGILDLLPVITLAVVVAAGMIAPFAFANACTPSERAVARTALDATQLACALAKDGTSQEIAVACALEADAQPLVEQLLSAKRRMAAAHCPSAR